MLNNERVASYRFMGRILYNEMLIDFFTPKKMTEIFKIEWNEIKTDKIIWKRVSSVLFKNSMQSEDVCVEFRPFFPEKMIFLFIVVLFISFLIFLRIVT